MCTGSLTKIRLLLSLYFFFARGALSLRRGSMRRTYPTNFGSMPGDPFVLAHRPQEILSHHPADVLVFVSHLDQSLHQDRIFRHIFHPYRNHAADPVEV